jgi:uncharacterized protein YeaO (DUF488 family)
MSKLLAKRAYDPPARGDGQRILVDRIWPRGLRKAELEDAIWMKELAPSTKLRQWFGHKPERWNEFRKRYWAELNGAQDQVASLKRLTKKGTVTLLYSAHDTEHNQAVALKEYLQRRH